MAYSNTRDRNTVEKRQQNDGSLKFPEGYQPPAASQQISDDGEGDWDLEQQESSNELPSSSPPSSLPPQTPIQVLTILATSIAERCFTIAQRAPLDRIEHLLQMRHEMLRQKLLLPEDDFGSDVTKCAKACYRNQGLTGFWRGYRIRCLSLFPLIVVNNIGTMCTPWFYSVAYTLNFPPIMAYLFSQMASYSFAALFSHPIEVIQLRLACDLVAERARVRSSRKQNNSSNNQSGEEVEEKVDTSLSSQSNVSPAAGGAMSFLKVVIKEEGPLALWRGLVPSLLTSAAGNLSFLLINEFLHVAFPGMYNTPIKEACSTFGVMCTASLIIHPLHTIRRRLILTIGSEKKYRYKRGFWDVVRTIGKEEGGLVRGLWSGVSFHLSRAAGGFAWSLIVHLLKRPPQSV